jgi:hypothetical protein
MSRGKENGVSGLGNPSLQHSQNVELTVRILTGPANHHLRWILFMRIADVI